MYFARILFFCNEEFTFRNLSDNSKELFSDGNYKCTIFSKKQGDRTKIIIEFGGFETRVKAKDEGINLLRNIKLEMCSRGNPINISGIMGMLDSKELSVMPGRITDEGLAYVKEQLIKVGRISEDKRVMEDVLGLEIYEVVNSMSEIYFVSQEIKIKCDTDFELNIQRFKYWNEKLDVALSFLNTSILINDVRIKFLLKIMAIEVLVSEREKNEEAYINSIDRIIKDINNNDELMARIKNDIGQLKIKSIGKKCRKLVEVHCNNKYLELEAV
ncbi:MAG: hypothetical protein ACRC7N_01955, partial [Clostridium sp.]